MPLLSFFFWAAPSGRAVRHSASLRPCGQPPAGRLGYHPCRGHADRPGSGGKASHQPPLLTPAPRPTAGSSSSAPTAPADSAAPPVPMSSRVPAGFPASMTHATTLTLRLPGRLPSGTGRPSGPPRPRPARHLRCAPAPGLNPPRLQILLFQPPRRPASFPQPHPRRPVRRPDTPRPGPGCRHSRPGPPTRQPAPLPAHAIRPASRIAVLGAAPKPPHSCPG